MDWRTDEKVWDIDDEFMFELAILVSPVIQEGATERDVYLPPAAKWYASGREIDERRRAVGGGCAARKDSALCKSGIDSADESGD
jgi:hypothetical protein